MLMRFLLTFVLMLSSGANTQELIRVIAVEYPPFLTSESQSFGTSFILLKQYADSHLKISYEPMFVPPGRAQYIIEHGEWCMSFYPPKPHDKKARFVQNRQK
jgi:polar amino acid transport system substrate-binding protein